ncbi:MAG: hypothetical protein IJH34_09595 [Romboutsia sp.]|nr:hypothetical protein [Romboutsia sp.]
MIEYKDQMKMSFSIGPFEDFINEVNMSMLKIVEATGNIMPAIELHFKADEPRLIAYINETHSLKIQLGVKEIRYDCEYRIYSKNIDRESEGNFNIVLYALMNNSNYLLTPIRRTLGNCTESGEDISGLEILLSVAKENFSRVETNIEKSQDSMLRIQHGISNKQFIDELWETIYCPDTFVLTGITANAKFKVVDLKALSSQNPKWKFSYKPSSDSDITPQKTFIRDNSGVNNYLFGYIRQRQFFNEDSGEFYVSTTGNSTLLSMAESFNRDDIWMLNTQAAVNDNMYNEYWEVRDTNLSNFALFSSVNDQFTFDPDWKDVEVLDLAYIEAPNPAARPEEAYSGLAIVCGVSRVYYNKKWTTYISLNREGFNQIL